MTLAWARGPQAWLLWSSMGAFMVPALSLVLPSGYSYGAVLLLLAALASSPRWWHQQLPRPGWALVMLFFSMALFWLADVSAGQAWGGLDRPSKYLLVLPCIFFVMAWPPRPTWLLVGIAAGGVGAGAVSLVQIFVLGLPRANGFTNAIQYGDLAALLALQSGLLLTVLWRTIGPWQRMLLAAGVVLGLLASLLSQARGGWLALALVLLVLASLLKCAVRQKRLYLGLGALATVAGLLTQVPFVHQRLEQAQQEVASYTAGDEKDTSVGHRLAHWRLAWEMGRDKPLTGWGQAGYEVEKARRVAAGDAPATVLKFGHAHNEALDLWAKHGLVGVLLLVLFYGVPMVLLWPTATRIYDARGQLDRWALALCLVGVAIPLSYVGFGLTQVFLAHNSGNMFYLFMCPLVVAALHERRARLGCRAPSEKPKI